MSMVDVLGIVPGPTAAGNAVDPYEAMKSLASSPVADLEVAKGIYIRTTNDKAGEQAITQNVDDQAVILTAC